MKYFRRIATTVLLLAMAATAMPQDWQREVRSAAERKDLAGALAMVERRLASNPGEIEARGWRARLLAWSGRLAESEREYREIVEQAPQDVDLVAGLADVLTWQGKLDDALAELENAPPNVEVLLRRARLLRRLHRLDEAEANFRQVLRLDPANAEARTALERGDPEARHELRFGADTDRFNYTDTATAQSVTLTSHWRTGWTTSISSLSYQRFGAIAERVQVSVSRKIGDRSWIAVAGGGGHDEGVIPRHEAGLEIGRAFVLPGHHLIRGLEATYGQQWLWFEASRVQVVSGTALLYLPREWTLTIGAGGARSSFSGNGVEWQPTGSARLKFPLRSPRWFADLNFAVGAENFAKGDEIGHFSARTFGGGVRYRWTRRQDVSVGVFFQDRSQGRTQTSLAISYGIRF